MTRMEGLENPLRTKGAPDGQDRGRASRKRDSQERSFDFYGQLAIAARLRG